ncbi:hypothetical protein [Salmonella enterica]
MLTDNTISLKEMVPGIYFLQIILDDGTVFFRKIVKD